MKRSTTRPVVAGVAVAAGLVLAAASSGSAEPTSSASAQTSTPPASAPPAGTPEAGSSATAQLPTPESRPEKVFFDPERKPALKDAGTPPYNNWCMPSAWGLSPGGTVGGDYISCIYGFNSALTINPDGTTSPMTFYRYRVDVDSGTDIDKYEPSVWGSDQDSIDPATGSFECLPWSDAAPWCGLYSNGDQNPEGQGTEGTAALNYYMASNPLPYWDMVSLGHDNPHKGDSKVLCGPSLYTTCTGTAQLSDHATFTYNVYNLPIIVKIQNNLPVPPPPQPGTVPPNPDQNVMHLAATPTSTPAMVWDKSIVSKTIAPGDTGYFALYQPWQATGTTGDPSGACTTPVGDDGGTGDTTLCLPKGMPAFNFTYTVNHSPDIDDSNSVGTTAIGFNVQTDGKGGVLLASNSATGPTLLGSPTSFCAQARSVSQSNPITSCGPNANNFITLEGPAKAPQTLTFNIFQ